VPAPAAGKFLLQMNIIADERKNMETVKLNLGCGDFPIEGYTNIDRKRGQEAYPLNCDDTSVDEIRASHILEHFGSKETFEVLKNWVIKLKPGGVLKIAVPDFAKIAEGHKNGDMNTTAYLCGGQLDDNDFHKNIFDRESLTKLLEMAGLVDIKLWESKIEDCASLPVSLNLQGSRPNIVNPKLEKILKGFVARKKNIYSQFGEDGIIEAIFERIGEKNRWCLEVGASDGILFSNTRRLVEQGWHAILIESDKLAYDRLVENCKDYPNARPVLAEVGPGCTLNSILKKYNAPKDIDLMSIDVDGQDYHVINAMIEYEPRILIVEYDPSAEIEFIPTVGREGQTGESAIRRLSASKGYCASIKTAVNQIMLHKSNFESTKSEELGIKPLPTKKGSTKKVTISKKIAAIMSAPRLGFTNNLMIAAKVLVPLGIEIQVGYGVYWSQVLSRTIQKEIDKGTEWIVVLDYDSYYTKEHFLALCQLMAQYPEVDAIMPIQIKRESSTVLAGINDPARGSVPYGIDTDLIEVDTGHFGLTFFKLSSFAKLKKPWFVAKPNDKGEWDEGRLDADINFWRNWRECGLKLCLTPQVLIGHMQLMVTWPGTLEKGSKPYHQYLNDIDTGGLPEWCKVSEDYKPGIIKQHGQK